MSNLRVAPSKDELLRRVELLAKAEELAAIAHEQAALSHSATSQDLLSLEVVATAWEQAARCSAGAYARWAQAAESDGDPLLARSLETVASTLGALAEQSRIASSEANAYAEAVQDDGPAFSKP